MTELFQVLGQHPLPRNSHVGFGPFKLYPDERRLERDGVPVRLGGRAVELLIALVESAGQVVGKRDLISRVWPDVVVEEGSLRFHILAIRKALSDGESGVRYVANMAGRGYSFVAPITRGLSAPRVAPTAQEAPASISRAAPAASIPEPASPVVGRTQDIDCVAKELLRRRLVTIVGSGGIGKTTLAIAVVRRLQPEFAADVRFVDLSVLSDAALVTATVAAALGVVWSSTAHADDFASLLGDRRVLLVLDCCEHLVDSVAVLTESLFCHAPGVHVLATSREALRSNGEFVYRLGPLLCPPANASLTLAEAIQFPAVKLFVERASVGGNGLALGDGDVHLIARLCRELDGIALAIELAAGRVEVFGLQGVVDLLDKRIRLMWHGRRTAVPRQQTMGATLDWSYNLLSDLEKMTLRRLAIFVGGFTLEAASFVAQPAPFDDSDIYEAIGNLVSKSLVSMDAGGSSLRYALLDTTRFYGLQRLHAAGEGRDTSHRHATFFRNWLENGPGDGTKRPIASVALELGNVRAALDWCLTAHNDVLLGCGIAAASAASFLESSMLGECRKWSDLSIELLPQELLGTRQEMELQAALGQATMFGSGNTVEVDRAFARGLAIAIEIDDRPRQLQLMSAQVMLCHRLGDFRAALAIARRAAGTVAEGDREGTAVVESTLGVALHMVGELGEADHRWTIAIALGARSSTRTETSRFGFDHHLRSLCGRARSLWLRGQSDEALHAAEDAIAQAEALGHPASLCIVLIWAGAVFVWAGDRLRAKKNADALMAMAERHALLPYVDVARGLTGLLHVDEGRFVEGVALLQSCLRNLHASRYEMMTTVFVNALARGFIGQGLLEEALQACADAMGRIERNGDDIHLAEALLNRGDALITHPAASSDAEESYAKAYDVASRQGALPWQLRAALALSRVWVGQGRLDRAEELLRPIVDVLGRELTGDDLVSARALLDSVAPA